MKYDIVYTKCILTLMQFEWDETKNQKNQQKHYISFEEAAEIFQGVVFTFTIAIRNEL